MKTEGCSYKKWKNYLVSFLFLSILIHHLPFSTAQDINSEPKIWSGEIVLTEDYTIQKSQTLIIKPGTTVKIGEGVKLIVYGNLTAVGNKSRPIVFTKHKEIKWCGIRGERGSKITLEYCRIEHSTDGIVCRSCSAIIRNCTISSDVHGIFLFGWPSPSSLTALIEGNVITNASTGIGIGGRCSVIIQNNLIIKGLDGIRILTGPPFSSIAIINNTIGNNRGWGIIAASDNISIENNTFEYNGIPNGKGRILKVWVIHVKVIDLLGFPINGVNVSAYNRFGEKVWEFKTGEEVIHPNGRVEKIFPDGEAGSEVEVYYIDNNNTKTTFTPYTVYIQIGDIVKSYTVLLDTKDGEITVRLQILAVTSKLIIVGAIVTICVMLFALIRMKKKNR